MAIIEITCQECGCLFQVEMEDGVSLAYVECPRCGNDEKVDLDE